ncbi:MAG TPA: aminotransferase class IV [Elusimicrobiota bacterium]|nr:aminotransferase class IV [Elusimicrobiota bacterium]
MPKKIWVNGRLVDPRRPAVSVFDRGFLYGDGVYETIRVYDGKPFQLEPHFQRLARSLRGIGMRVPFGRAVLGDAVASVMAANRLADGVVRLTVTRGEGALGFDPASCRRPTVVLLAVPFASHPAVHYEKGVRAVFVRLRRNAKNALDPSIKSLNNLNNILAKMESMKKGGQEALMLNQEGYLTEGTISNIFFISGGVLKTPSLDCGLLDGVTRSVVLSLAKRRSLAVWEGRCRPRHLFSAEEVFLTSTTLEVMPVTSVVDEQGRLRRIGSGQVGEWSGRLLRDYRRLITKATGKKFKI